MRWTLHAVPLLSCSSTLTLLLFLPLVLHYFSLPRSLWNIRSLSLPLPDNECRNSPSYVFSSAWRLVSAHGPLIINLTLCAGRLIIPTYLYDSELTSSPGVSVFSRSLSLSLRLVVLNLLQPRHEKSSAPKAPHLQTFDGQFNQRVFGPVHFFVCVVQIRLYQCFIELSYHLVFEWLQLWK